MHQSPNLRPLPTATPSTYSTSLTSSAVVTFMRYFPAHHVTVAASTAAPSSCLRVSEQKNSCLRVSEHKNSCVSSAREDYSSAFHAGTTTKNQRLVWADRSHAEPTIGGELCPDSVSNSLARVAEQVAGILKTFTASALKMRRQNGRS